jgi:hypothetical protein
MRLLEDISPQSNHYSTEVKLSMLQNAVSIVPKLSSIRDISNNLVAIGNDPLGYQAYSELLISGCNQLDKDLEITHSKSKRTVNYTNFKEEDYFDPGYLDAGDSYFTKENEQDNAWTILAAESSAQEKVVGAPFFPRALWDLIPEEVREYIRNNREPTRRTRPPPPRGGPPNRGTRLIAVTRTTMAPQLAHQLNDVPMSTMLLAAIKRLTAMSSLMLSTPIRMHQHWLQCQEKILFWLPYKNRRPSVSFWPIRTGLLQPLHQPRLTTAPLSLTVNATLKLIPTVFSTNSAKQPVLTTAKEFLPSFIEVLTVAWPEKMPASLSILSARQTSVVSTIIPWLAYPLSLRQVS